MDGFLWLRFTSMVQTGQDYGGVALDRTIGMVSYGSDSRLWFRLDRTHVGVRSRVRVWLIIRLRLRLRRKVVGSVHVA